MFVSSQVFLFLECLCASQDSFNWEWAKTKSNKLEKNVHLVALIRDFLSQHPWRKSQETFLIGPLWVMCSPWTNHCGQEDGALWLAILGLRAHLCGGRARRWEYWLERMTEQHSRQRRMLSPEREERILEKWQQIASSSACLSYLLPKHYTFSHGFITRCCNSF